MSLLLLTALTARSLESGPLSFPCHPPWYEPRVHRRRRRDGGRALNGGLGRWPFGGPVAEGAPAHRESLGLARPFDRTGPPRPRLGARHTASSFRVVRPL